MGRIITTDEQNYIDIAEAIRTKTGETESSWLSSELASGILAIPSGYKILTMQLPNQNQLQSISPQLFGITNIVGAMVFPVSAVTSHQASTLLLCQVDGSNYCLYYNDYGQCVKEENAGRLMFNGSSCTIYAPYIFAATTNYILFIGT